MCVCVGKCPCKVLYYALCTPALNGCVEAMLYYRSGYVMWPCTSNKYHVTKVIKLGNSRLTLKLFCTDTLYHLQLE